MLYDAHGGCRRAVMAPRLSPPPADAGHYTEIEGDDPQGGVTGDGGPVPVSRCLAAV
jgi:hypothetical protein